MGRVGRLGFGISNTTVAIGRREREGEWAASTSVSYMWRRTGHSERRELAKNWSTNKALLRNSRSRRTGPDLTGTFCTKWKEREST